jgi:hypothetical protein
MTDVGVPGNDARAPHVEGHPAVFAADNREKDTTSAMT